MNLANLFEGYADTALAAWNDPKSKSADQKSSKFYLTKHFILIKMNFERGFTRIKFLSGLRKPNKAQL